MKNRSFKLWDKALMIEAINQTKWPAAIMFVLSALALTYQAITEQIIKFDYFYIVICAFAMFMIYRLFSFQNKRVSSDLYHGLPKSRGIIFVSFITAVVIWFLIEIPVCLAANDIIIQTGVNKYFHWESILKDSLYYIAGIIQLMGITSFAMALTGNTLANILAAISIMIVPRILVNSYIDVFYDLCPFLTENHVLQKWSSPDFNILYTLYEKAMRIYSNPALVVDFWTEPELSSENIRTIATVYSAFIGFLYMGFGAMFFKKRMSEKAGSSTTNSFVQLMLKVAVAMAICVAPTSIVSESIINGQELAIGDLVLMYLVAVLAWFLIDLLTLRKHFDIKKCVMLLPVLVLLNVLAGTAIVSGTLTTASHIPEISEMKSVRVMGDIAVEDTDEYLLQGEFIKQIELTDEDIKELMLSKLNEEMKLFKEDYASYKKISYSGEVGYFEVAFETDKGVIYRNLYEDISVQNMLYEALKKTAADTYDYELPVTGNMSAGNYVSYLSILDNNDYRLAGKLYDELYKELSENKYPMSYYLDRSNNKAVFATLVRTEQGYDYKLPVSADTPETLEKFIELTNEGYDSAYIDPNKKEDNSKRVLSVKAYSASENKYYYGKRYFNGVSDLKNIGKKLESFMNITEADEEIDITKNLVAVELWYSNIYIGCRWCNVSDEELDILVNMSSLNFMEVSDLSKLYY